MELNCGVGPLKTLLTDFVSFRPGNLECRPSPQFSGCPFFQDLGSQIRATAKPVLGELLNHAAIGV